MKMPSATPAIPKKPKKPMTVDSLLANTELF